MRVSERGIVGGDTLKTRKPRVGDWVQVKSKEEILRTLDVDGQLDGMPFMPEMFAFCGKRLQVYKRAHKTCDTVFPVRGRRVERTVHLDTRCDGSQHGGCQAGCLIFWKEAWLRPAPGNAPAGADTMPGGSPLDTLGEESGAPTAAALNVFDKAQQVGQDGQTTYVCQATRLPYATKDLDWWDVRQYIEDYTSGNVGLWQIVCGGMYSGYYKLTRAGIGLGPALRWFYDAFHPLWRGTPFPRKTGSIPMGKATPAETLDLQPGEVVQIKSHEEILRTLDTGSRNRGLYWDAEEVPYCGGTYRVLRRVSKIVDERTGKMREMKTPCVQLESVICQSRYSECRLFCPRSIYPYWREIWLRRKS